jgi:hypothetical protein
MVSLGRPDVNIGRCSRVPLNSQPSSPYFPRTSSRSSTRSLSRPTTDVITSVVYSNLGKRRPYGNLADYFRSLFG